MELGRSDITILSGLGGVVSKFQHGHSVVILRFTIFNSIYFRLDIFHVNLQVDGCVSPVGCFVIRFYFLSFRVKRSNIRNAYL